MLKIHVFWDVLLHHCIIRSQCTEGTMLLQSITLNQQYSIISQETQIERCSSVKNSNLAGHMLVTCMHWISWPEYQLPHTHSLPNLYKGNLITPISFALQISTVMFTEISENLYSSTQFHPKSLSTALNTAVKAQSSDYIRHKLFQSVQGNVSTQGEVAGKWKILCN